MKKIISIMLCVLIILFCPIYAYAQTEEIISEIDIEHEMTSAEIDEFLLTARPISDLVSSEDKPIEEKIDSSLDRNGSYKYDAKTQQVTFESAENINLYNARAEEKTESISFGVDSEYFPKNINVSEEIGGISTFGIIGDDNRTRVKDTTKGPWCNTVRLLMKINGNILSYMSNKLLGEGNTVASIDELYLFLSNLTAIEYIRNAMKRVRKKDSAVILASQNIDDFLIPSVKEYTKPLFSIPTHHFLFFPGNINPKDFEDALMVEPNEYALIKFGERGTCLYRCGNERYLLLVQAPEYKAEIFGSAGGR